MIRCPSQRRTGWDPAVNGNYRILKVPKRRRVCGSTPRRLESALLRGNVAHLYAGEGIVRDSVASEELEANEAKLQALLPLLT